MGQPVIFGWSSVSGLDTRGMALCRERRIVCPRVLFLSGSGRLSGVFSLRCLMYFCPFYNSMADVACPGYCAVLLIRAPLPDTPGTALRPFLYVAKS
jgi:hypothetical protein